jgi:hypothetical protein
LDILDRPAQDVFLADDIDIVGCIGRGWNKIIELAQIFRSAYLVQLISIFESPLEKDEIYRPFLTSELEDQAVYNLVCPYVERFREKVLNAKVGYFLGESSSEQRTPFSASSENRMDQTRHMPTASGRQLEAMIKRTLGAHEKEGRETALGLEG